MTNQPSEDHWLYGDPDKVKKRKANERAKRKVNKMLAEYERMRAMLLEKGHQFDEASQDALEGLSPIDAVAKVETMIETLIPSFLDEFPELSKPGTKGNIGWLLADMHGNGGSRYKNDLDQTEIKKLVDSKLPMSPHRARQLTWITLKDHIVNGNGMEEFMERMNRLDDRAYCDTFLRLLGFMQPKPVAENQNPNIVIKIVNDGGNMTIDGEFI